MPLKRKDLILTWVTPNSILLAQGLASSVGIDFGNDDSVLCVHKGIRQFFVYRCKVLWLNVKIKFFMVFTATYLAVTATGCESRSLEAFCKARVVLTTKVQS